MRSTFFCTKTPSKITIFSQSLKNENSIPLETATSAARNVDDSEITGTRRQQLTVTGNDIYLYKISPFNDYVGPFIEVEVAFRHPKCKDTWDKKISDDDTKEKKYIR
jgi:hypothetical protein